MVSEMLPARLRFLLTAALLVLATAVIVVLLREAWIHFTSPILFNSSGLNRLLQDSGLNQLLGTKIEFRAAYIYFGMVLCFVMLLAVNVELLLRMIGRKFGNPNDFPEPEMPDYFAAGAE